MVLDYVYIKMPQKQNNATDCIDEKDLQPEILGDVPENNLKLSGWRKILLS